MTTNQHWRKYLKESSPQIKVDAARKNARKNKSH
jgi:hypothetical protein